VEAELVTHSQRQELLSESHCGNRKDYANDQQGTHGSHELNNPAALKQADYQYDQRNHQQDVN
jgi:hypothetical protein